MGDVRLEPDEAKIRELSDQPDRVQERLCCPDCGGYDGGGAVPHCSGCGRPLSDKDELDSYRLTEIREFAAAGWPVQGRWVQHLLAQRDRDQRALAAARAESTVLMEEKRQIQNVLYAAEGDDLLSVVRAVTAEQAATWELLDRVHHHFIVQDVGDCDLVHDIDAALAARRARG